MADRTKDEVTKEQINLLGLIWEELRRTNTKLDELKGITLGNKNAK